MKYSSLRIFLFILLSLIGLASCSYHTDSTTRLAQPTNLEDLQGQWKTTVTSWNSPGSPPRTTRGYSQQSLIPNSKVLIEHNSAPQLSPSMKTTALFGFDPESSKFISLWKNPFTQRIGISEGRYNQESGQYTMKGVSIDPVSKQQSPIIV